MSEVIYDKSLSGIHQAVRYRQALMIGLLISRPVRRRAFLSMTVSEHLKKVSDGYWLGFKEEDMKDARAREFTLPVQLVEPMESYLARFRLRLLQGKKSECLWINQYGKPITNDGYSRELPKLMQRHLGVSLRPHAFRHVAATSIAETDPEHVNIIRDILGHQTRRHPKSTTIERQAFLVAILINPFWRPFLIAQPSLILKCRMIVISGKTLKQKGFALQLLRSKVEDKHLPVPIMGRAKLNMN